MPATTQSSFRKAWREAIVPIVIVTVVSIAGWQYRPLQPCLSMVLLAIGLWFDAFSAFFYILGLVTRRHVSGFPIIGLFCYALAWLACPRAVLVTVSGGLGVLWLCKLADLVALVGFHLLFHVPFWTLIHRFPPRFNSDARTERQA